MRAGRLRHRVSIQAPAETQDAAGGLVTTWAEAHRLWAEVETLTGREYAAAAQINAEVTARIRLRHIAGLTTEMRAVSGGVYYDILAVIPDVRNVETHLLCKARP